jgi:hypothetical protein
LPIVGSDTVPASRRRGEGSPGAPFAPAERREGGASRLRGVASYALGWPATLLVGLAASAPVITAVVRALHDGWSPVADRAIIATRAYDVFSGHMPLVGQYSFASQITGHPTYSLGPMLYWLLAPAAHIGSPSSLALTMAVLNTASIVLAVALARRRGGPWLMLATAAAIAVMCRSLTAADFYDIWNPAAALLPLLALAFVCWSLACGEVRLAPVAALLASYCAQSEDVFTVLVACLLLVGLAGLVLSRRARFRAGGGAEDPAQQTGAAQEPVATGADPEDDIAPQNGSATAPGAGDATPARTGPRMWPWLVAGGFVLVVCWTAPVLDQLFGGGNIGHLVEAARSHMPREGWGTGVRAVVHTIGVRPWWLATVHSPWSRKYEVHYAVKSLAAISAALILGWLVIAVVLGLLRRRLDVAAGAACALAMCLGIAAGTASTPTGRILGGTLAYTLWTSSIVGAFTWLVAVWSAVVLASSLLRGPRRAPAARTRAPAWLRPAALGLAACAAAVAVWFGTTGQQPDEHIFEFPAVHQLNAGLAAVPRGSVVNLAARLDGIVTPLRPELTYALRRRGVRALGEGAYLRLGRWYELLGRRYRYVLWLYDRSPPKIPGGRVIATARLRAIGRERTLGLLLAPAPPPAARPRRSAQPAASSRPGRA